MVCLSKYHEFRLEYNAMANHGFASDSKAAVQEAKWPAFSDLIIHGEAFVLIWLTIMYKLGQ